MIDLKLFASNPPTTVYVSKMPNAPLVVYRVKLISGNVDAKYDGSTTELRRAGSTIDIGLGTQLDLNAVNGDAEVQYDLAR